MNEYWDKRFQTEGRIWGDSPSQTAEYALELFHKNNIKKILVPGSGYGRNTKLFSTAGFDVTGIEISSVACSIAEEFDPLSRFYNASVLDKSFDSERYDAIYCFNTLHLFREKERRLFIRQCTQRLREKGLLFFTVFSEEDSGRNARHIKQLFDAKQITVGGGVGRILARIFVAFGKPRMVGWRAHLAAALTVTGIGAIGLATVLYTIPEVPPAQPEIEQATVDVAEITTGPTPVIEATFASKPEPEPDPEIRLTMASLLEDPAVPKNTDSAFTDLFGLWGANYESGGANACEQALQQQLRCWFQKGTLSHLRRLNRPAILSLIDARGDEFQVVLSGLDATTATLRAGGVDYPIGFDDLANYWYGDHLILWRPVNADGSAIGPGSSGDDVIWLRDSLALIYGEAMPPRPSDVFDSALEERVRNFQRERRLAVDGIVGTQTQIVINTETAVPSTPVLAESH